MKYFLFLSPLVLVGCAATEWLVNNADNIEKGADAANGFGPYGPIVGLGATTLVGFAKWYEHKASAKEVIVATQKAKQALPEASKKLLKDAYIKHMPDVARDYVKKVKNKL